MALFNFCGFFYFFRFPRRKSFVGQLADLKLVPQLKGSKNIFFEQTPQSANLHLFHIIHNCLTYQLEPLKSLCSKPSRRE